MMPTIINNKTVNWEIMTNSKTSLHDDQPVEFMKVILKRKDSDSYDRSVSCVYRSKSNYIYILKPMSSFHWYVDGAAEKALGNSWHSIANGNLECKNSAKNGHFQFR